MKEFFENVKFVIGRVVWMFKQLLPLTYRSVMEVEDGKYTIMFWKMWMGQTYKIRKFVGAVKEEE